MSTTKMSDPRHLFLHELGDVLYAEKTLVKALPKLQEEASDAELASGFADHLEETRQHVKNLEQAFEALGEPAKAQKVPGIEGIKKEHDDFVQTSRRERRCSTPSSPAQGRARSTTRSPPTKGS